jgi:hypothetical protein
MSANKFTPESVLMTDWATDDLSMGGSAKSTIFELMLLSLLYDNVLIQDEVFALSYKCADWFSEEKDLELLRKCFDIESIVILKLPLFAYPTDELKELAQKAPIYARAEYIQRYGTRAEKIFIPNASQLSLYHNIDAWLLNRPKAQRPVGSLQKFDIMSTFGVILKEVLSSKLYKKWRETAFQEITDDMAEDFIKFIEEPDKVVGRLKEKGIEFKTVVGPDGKPTFNRSLGFLASTLYSPKQAKAMQRLIQTTFAAPFSWRENAAGRYSKFLRELLWMPADTVPDDLEYLEKGEIVSVEAHVDTRISLPEIDTDYVEAINHVRNTDAGKKLRISMHEIEKGINFNKQKEAWDAVSYELAKVVVKKKSITIRTALVRVGKEFVVGSVASGLFSIGQPVNVPRWLGEALLGGVLGIASDHIYAMLRSDVKRQKLRQKIERAVEFRCTPIEIPALATPVVSNQ